MTKLRAEWRQIAGFSVQEDGSMGLVWLSVDPEWDVLRVHHAVTFQREVMAVIAQELKKRPFVPVAWENKEFADTLLNDYGCNMLYDASRDTPSAAERLSNEIWERMRTGRFKIGPSADEFVKEQKQFNRQGSKILREGYPLMAATRHAVDQLQYARTEQSVTGGKKANFPKVAIA